MEKTIVISLIALALSGCENNSSSCPITIDSLYKLGYMDSYYFYQRISGVQDKTRIIEIYSKEPVFNQCNEPNTAPVYDDSVESEGYLEKIIYHTQSNSTDITYTENKNTNINLSVDNQ